MPKENLLSKIARRRFIQFSAAAAAGCFIRAGADVQAQDLPHLAEDDPTARSLKYVNKSVMDDQKCANCGLIQGNEGEQWRPCQVFPGKLVNAAGWCSVWAPQAS